MKKTAIILMIITLISKMLGLVRETTLAYFFPTDGAVANAFLVSQILPITIISLFSAGISTSFIPLYNKIVHDNGRKQGDIFTSNINNIVTIIIISLIIVLEIFTPTVVKIFAPGFTGYTRELTIKFMRLTLFSMIPSIIACVFKGYLNANNHFVVQNLQGFIMNFFIILALIISKKYDDNMIVGVGLLLGNALQYVPYYFIAKRKKFKYYKVLDFSDKNIKMIVLLSIPIILGVSVNQINVMVDKSIASTVSTNGIPILNYASRLIEFVTGIVIANISVIIYPELSRNFIENNLVKMKESIMKSMSMICILVIPATIGLLVLCFPITKMLFFRGAFTMKDVTSTATCMFFYSLGIIGTAIRDILSKSFYAMNDTKTPTINSVIMVAMNIIGNLLLSKIFGLIGLAVATSMSSLIGALMITVRLYKKIGDFKTTKNSFRNIFKMLIASLIMGILSYFTFKFSSIKFNNNISLMFSIAAACISYTICIFTMKVDELNDIINFYKNRRKKR
ncbi:murein biosynthesis integral membrane protein MurJ [uncultured Finegoldia sp.]|uniref:murein biosynthesis integral membrane protein MurJ n=1 Tax=uncultured Finegoldia sp. TaxID=328009 RepID=UPI002606763F|nr:murein biosynthesis integral membrane protein MurJ [uncultured Finegoldia sp.]